MIEIDSLSRVLINWGLILVLNILPMILIESIWIVGLRKTGWSNLIASMVIRVNLRMVLITFLVVRPYYGICLKNIAIGGHTIVVSVWTTTSNTSFIHLLHLDRWRSLWCGYFLCLGKNQCLNGFHKLVNLSIGARIVRRRSRSRSTHL